LVQESESIDYQSIEEGRGFWEKKFKNVYVTIVLVAPERLGLASLHQLRGRVSRNGLKGYCFLYTNLQKSQRLEEFSKSVSGFDIAELDLKYREGGDMLKGVFQSGKSFLWFDMSEDEETLKKVKALL